MEFYLFNNDSFSLLEQLFNTSQSANSRYFKGPHECIAHLFKTKGIRSLFRGITSMAIRDVPGYGIYILIYEWMFYHMRRLDIGDRHGAFASIMAGGWAGVLSWAIMAPTDVVKSLMQADVSHTKYRNVLHCVQHTYRHFGIKAFYAGCAINCVRGFPVNAFTLLVYSQVLNHLNSRQPTDGFTEQSEELFTHTGSLYHVDIDLHVELN